MPPVLEVRTRTAYQLPAVAVTVRPALEQRFATVEVPSETAPAHVPVAESCRISTIDWAWPVMLADRFPLVAAWNRYQSVSRLLLQARDEPRICVVAGKPGDAMFW